MRILLLLLTLLLLATQAYANPIVINYSHDFLWATAFFGETPLWVPILSAIAALVLEYSVLRVIVGLRNPKIAKLGRRFLTINSITFPVTQVIAILLGPVSEILPVVAEKLFYNRDMEFKEWGYRGWAAVIGVNLLSYFIGVVSSELFIRVVYD